QRTSSSAQTREPFSAAFASSPSTRPRTPWPASAMASSARTPPTVSMSPTASSTPQAITSMRAAERAWCGSRRERLRASSCASASFLSPRYQFASAAGQQDNPYGIADGFTDGEIPPVPTTQTPVPFGADRLGVIVVTPDPARFPPPWPAAIYGPGFTRSDYDLFVTADYNASLGIVTLATDPSGHGFGPLSTTTVTANGTPTTFLSYGRGRDLDGDGVIGDGL